MLLPIARAGVFLGFLLASGCGATRYASAPPAERDVLTREMIIESRATNAYDVVATLRSNWLRTRGVDSFSTPGEVLVYYNDTRLGGVEMLRGISLNEIGYIQYFDGTEASARWGLDHGHGVIYVGTLTPP